MCGIFGLVANKNFYVNYPNKIKEIASSLFILSQTRGSEAAGVAINNSHSLSVLKDAASPKQFIKSKEYKYLLSNSLEEYSASCENLNNGENFHFSLIGHSRLVTNGDQSESVNNQPVIVEGVVGVHNGIITNENQLLKDHSDITKSTNLDSELLFKLFDKNFLIENDSFFSIRKTLNQIKGSVSVAYFNLKNHNLNLATNTGSIFLFKE